MWIPGCCGKHGSKGSWVKCAKCACLFLGDSNLSGEGDMLPSERSRTHHTGILRLVQETLQQNSDQVFLPCLLRTFADRLPESRKPLKVPCSIPFYSLQVSGKPQAIPRVSGALGTSFIPHHL